MTRNRMLSPVLFAVLAAPLALAQQPAPPAAPMPPARPMMMDRRGPGRGGPEEGGMRIAPPGTWWKNPDTIARLSLTADQQKKMDDIFRQNRLQLVDVKASLDKEQINLEPLLNANPVDSGKALAEISKIADLRAGLEKADAKMLLELRAVLSADQWTKLQAEQHEHRGGAMGTMDRRGMGNDRPTPSDHAHGPSSQGPDLE